MLSFIYFIAFLLSSCAEHDFKLTILHTNDLHSNFEGVMTKEETHSGIGRVITYVTEERKKRTGPDEAIIYLDAGDMFTGTDWFAFNNTDIASDFMNLLRPDALCLGNHEFDLGIKGLRRYIDLIGQPVLSCNVDIKRDPSFIGKIIPSTILEVKNRRIGIVAYLHPNTRTTDAYWGNITLHAERPLITREIDKLKKQNVNIIILLTHGGYKRDIKIAEKSTDIDLIVDGHSHTFLYSGNDSKVMRKNIASGSYPIVIENRQGKKVYIVQAFCNAEYVGKFIVTFNSHGEVIQTEGTPHVMDSSVRFNKQAKRILKKYRPFVERKRQEIVGKSQIFLKGGRPCRRHECNLGNLILDSYVFYAARQNTNKKYWTNTSISIINAGNIRKDIQPHWRTKDINYAQILGAIPFFNLLVTITVSGKTLRLALEHSLSWSKDTHKGEFLQMSGIRVVYDYKKPLGSRVVHVRVRCARCEIPKYEVLHNDQMYNIITTDFLAGGGSGYKMFKHRPQNKGSEDEIDINAFKNYLFHHNVVDPEVEERITVLNDDRPLED